MKLLYLATADARGHLMRAQLLTHALRAQGIDVDVLTTSDEGARFLAGFGIEAPVLSRHYAVVFDAQQNMLRRETDRNIARYVFDPRRCLKDLGTLRRLARDADLVINDSFHPALLILGTLPGWRRKVVHVFGRSLRDALEANFEGRSHAWIARGFARIIAWEIGSARAALTHDFAFEAVRNEGARAHFLPTPVALAARSLDAPCDAAVYLNPHFRDPAIAQAIEAGVQAAQLSAHRVGEGYAERAGWLAQDARWIDQAAHSRVIVSAPGMAALSIALVYQVPIVLVVTDQPEQQHNARHAAAMGLRHRVLTWRGDTARFARELREALAALAGARDAQAAARGHDAAQARLQAWVEVLRALAAPASAPTSDLTPRPQSRATGPE